MRTLVVSILLLVLCSFVVPGNGSSPQVPEKVMHEYTTGCSCGKCTPPASLSVCYVHSATFAPWCSNEMCEDELPATAIEYSRLDCKQHSFLGISGRVPVENFKESVAVLKRRMRVRWELDFMLKDNRLEKKIFQQLFYNGCANESLLETRWQGCIDSGSVFRLASYIVAFLHRIYVARLGTRDIFTVIADDPRVRWLSEHVNAIVLNGALPFEQRKLLSTDCALAHADSLVAKKGLTPDTHEAIAKIIRTQFLSLVSIPADL